MLTGRVHKLLITPVVGVYDDAGRLVGEANGSPRVCYAGQSADAILAMLDDVMTDQAVLERIRDATRGRAGAT